ncbi:MAG TPA: AtpZ/AtpI family protein [Xanthobacteraceae bacterium]|nr:AtpZ/AtpI family protein [Xanthobacteraceae bacterium]
MADGARENGKQSATPADEAALSARLRRLGERLDRKRASRAAESEPGAGSASDPSRLAVALRLSAELVGGVAVGAGIGLGLDYLAGTSPWGFIVLVMLGFAGGVLTVMRSAGVIPERRL